jgi:hypothetical protein
MTEKEVMKQVIENLKEELNDAIGGSAYHHRKFKEYEIKIIGYKQSINTMEQLLNGSTQR